MRLLPSGSTSLLVEVADLDEVLGLYGALVEARLPGVLDLVPAARTVLVVTEPSATSLDAVAAALRSLPSRRGGRERAELLEIPVTYDGEDLDEVARLWGCDRDEVVREHGRQEWTVAFCGFAPGFGYLVSSSWTRELPRRASPRTRVPRGAVGLAGEFCGVYPREAPGGWQLVGRTELEMFDPAREPEALLRPGVRVRFVEAGRE